MTESRTPARRAAYLSLTRCDTDRKYSNLEIDAAIRRFGLEGAEKGLYTTLVYGVIERRLTLDYLISRLSTRPASSLDPEIRTILRLGLYQLVWLDRVPESAAVNESVELAKRFRPRAASFVNAVLRGFLRTMGRDRLPFPDKSDLAAYLSVRYSCGRDVTDALIASVEDPEAVLAAFDTQPAVTLRVNTLKITREALLSLLAEKGVGASGTVYSPFGVKLEGHTLPAAVLELIEKGIVYIQDEASQLALAAAAPAPGMTVIGACAGPGGKSFFGAMLMENSGKILSFDLHKSKLSLVEAGAAKLGVTILSTAEKNGAVYDPSLDALADLVLCDVPCSGFGVIGKKPEIRYKEAAEFSRLPDVQYAILSNCSRYVKPGGVLLYTTCTLNRPENDGTLDRFLADHPAFRPVPFTAGPLSAENGRLTLLPQSGTDGFYIARLARTRGDTII